jgi:hypothetical protein
VIVKRLGLIAALCVLAVSSLVSGTASAAKYDNLEPGEKARLNERVDVNLVFVGYEQDQVEESDVLAELPDTYKPIVRSRTPYGIKDFLGITYGYNFDTRWASAGYEDSFFKTLSGLATPAPRTEFQNAYNAQKNNVLNVTQNHFIDAPSVERWLADNPPAGVDTTEDTIFFVNWYNRDDFKFHVYTKTNEPDPDTGYNFGTLRESRKIISWGGTAPADEENGYSGPARRIWFYDLSAGPESWTDNWNVDDPDLDGNGQVDYRMPPIWEYTSGGFRNPAALGSDLGLVTRYVGINLLFTSSPLYPPDITPPALPETFNLDSNTYEAFPGGVDASDTYITTDLLLGELSELQTTVDYSYDEQELSFSGKARSCYVLWLQDVACYPNLDYPAFANLFLNNALKKNVWMDGWKTADYEAGLFNYATNDKLSAPFLGFADDNYRDGTQSYIFSFVSPLIADVLGYGLTTTMIHEVGHHVAMSHPHDGFDYESGVDYGPADSFYFAWSGDEQNSIMSYIDLNWDFSQFDQDNMNRFMAAEYITNANKVAARVLRSAQASEAAQELAQADKFIGEAVSEFSGHDYEGAIEAAKHAYDSALQGADDAGVVIKETHAGTTVDLNTPSPSGRNQYSHVDRIGKGGHRTRP